PGPSMPRSASNGPSNLGDGLDDLRAHKYALQAWIMQGTAIRTPLPRRQPSLMPAFAGTDALSERRLPAFSGSRRVDAYTGWQPSQRGPISNAKTRRTCDPVLQLPLLPGFLTQRVASSQVWRITPPIRGNGGVIGLSSSTLPPPA